MNNIAYVVVSNGTDCFIRRFEGKEVNKIAPDKNLPKCFQESLYGPPIWVAEEILARGTHKILEAIRLLVGDEVVERFCHSLFELGLRVGQRLGKK